MAQGRGGMGSRKHGQSGVAPHSPRFKHQMELDAKKKDRKRKKSDCKYSSVSEAVKDK